MRGADRARGLRPPAGLADRARPASTARPRPGEPAGRAHDRPLRGDSMTRCGPTWVWGCAALIVLGGCGRRQSSPTAPAPPPPPEIEQVYPPARSVGVPDETEIWAQVAEPLDPATVNEQNVRLHVDTIRITAAVSWEPETRRIHVRPSGPLRVGRTHTVELRAGLTTADGRALGHTYQWQFTTFSVRRPGRPFPADGTAGESPFVTLSWDSTDSNG